MFNNGDQGSREGATWAPKMSTLHPFARLLYRLDSHDHGSWHW